MPTNEDKAADRWYRRYLELQDKKRADAPASGDSDMEAALRQVERRLRDMNVQVYGGRRATGRSGKAAMLAKRRAVLQQAQREQARRFYRDYQNSGAPWGLAVRALQEALQIPSREAEALLEQVRQERVYRSTEQAFEDFGKALQGVFKITDDEDEEPEEDTRGPLSTGKGRRPQPAIVKTKVVTFRVTEFADPQYAGTDFGDYPADWVKERKGIHVQDIDGNEVYVAVDVVQRQVVAGKVPGYAALTPEEADSLHLVLVEAEHFQQALLRQATLEGDHDPMKVLAVSRANGAQAAYRKRLGLPLHTWSEECCGQWVAPVTKEASE